VFTNVINPRAAVNRKSEYRTTIIRKGATIGANATIICGNEIGAYAFVGAGAVVTRNVPPYALVTGNPARQKGWMSEHGEPLQFNADGFAICAAANLKYQLQGQEVKKVD